MSAPPSALGGVTIWSGIDTQNNPGTDKVQGRVRDRQPPTARTFYNEGHEAEARTNILIGATSVVGAATAVIGAFFTNWSGHRKEQSAPASVTPYVSYANGPAVGAVGRF